LASPLAVALSISSALPPNLGFCNATRLTSNDINLCWPVLNLGITKLVNDQENILVCGNVEIEVISSNSNILNFIGIKLLVQRYILGIQKYTMHTVICFVNYGGMHQYQTAA